MVRGLMGSNPVRRLVFVLALGAMLAGAAVDARALTDEELLDELESTAFDYFWNEANPSNGLIKDRSTSGSPCSIAAVGFGLSAICVGIDRGYVTREVGRDRVRTTLETFWNGPQGSTSSGVMGYMGFFYHFLDMNTGVRVWSCELSSIDTALFLAGALHAREYFDGVEAEEAAIRDLVDALYYRVDWNWMRNNGVGIRMGWNPESGFAPFGTWVGYNEAMILYILALGSPTHTIPASNWFTWTSGYSWQTHYGYSYVNFPPLFGHQYSHCWIDYRQIQDVYMRSQGITYFINSRRATLAAREYCIDNPLGWVGYGPEIWGLTASDGPTGYSARGAPPAQNDDGTITPTAAASSIAFAPEVVLPTLHYMYDTLGGSIWGPYGFKDAFNLTVAWVGTDYLGIDEGPIILMIENYRTQTVWNRFMANADVQTGLARATFLDATAVQPGPVALGTVLFQNQPNPFQGSTTVQFRLPSPSYVNLELFDARGRVVRTLVDQTMEAGDHWVDLQGNGLASGVYYYRLQWNGRQETRRAVLLR